MAHLFQRGKKDIWYAKYYRNGKQVLKSLKTSNYRIARSKATALEAGLDLHDYEKGVISPADNRSQERILLSKAIENFCYHLRDIRTQNSYDSEISRLRVMFGVICTQLKYTIPQDEKKNTIKVEYLDELTIPVIKKHFESRRRKESLSSATEKQNRALLHKFFEWAADHYNYRSTADSRYPNPVSAIKRPATKASVIRYLEKPDITEQLKVLKDHPQLNVMVAVCIYAGLRREEVVWLVCDDVDLERRIISVRAKTIHGEYWQPKTKKNRAIPISNSLFKILKQYKTKKDQLWYFPSSSGKRWHPDTFSHKLAKINTTNNPDWTCLDFRHTFGSQLAKRGVSLYKISELMGNSPEVCRKHYAAIRTEQLHDDVEF